MTDVKKAKVSLNNAKKNKFKLGVNSILHMEGVNPALVEIAYKAIEITPIDFGIPSTGGYRTGIEQKFLFHKGVTKADGLVKRSKHQDGLALDFFAYVDGKGSWESEHLTAIAGAFKESAKQLGYVVEWGGDWPNFKDLPHIELVTTPGGDPLKVEKTATLADSVVLAEPKIKEKNDPEIAGDEEV